MQLGDKGPEVRALRVHLNLVQRTRIPASDEFDYQLERAVRAYQRNRGLPITGVWEGSFGVSNNPNFSMRRSHHSRPDVDYRNAESAC